MRRERKKGNWGIPPPGPRGRGTQGGVNPREHPGGGLFSANKEPLGRKLDQFTPQELPRRACIPGSPPFGAKPVGGGVTGEGGVSPRGSRAGSTLKEGGVGALR